MKDQQDHISGPFTREEISRKISRGEFSGQEEICLYPEGSWKPISKDPGFYDQLLEALTREVTPSPRGAEREGDMDEPTPVMTKGRARQVNETRQTSTRESSSERSTTTQQRDERKERKKENRKGTRPSRGKRPSSSDSDVIELQPYEEVVEQGLQKKRLIFVASAALLLVLAWMLATPVSRLETDERVRLLRPGQNLDSGSLSADQIDSRLQRSKNEFFLDTVTTYIRAQNGFVQVVEVDESGKTLAAPLLCLTYLELWPFAYQDRQDRSTVNAMVRLSNQSSATFDYKLCSVVDLIIRGRYLEADNLITVLMNRLYELDDPPTVYYLFHYLRALTLEQGRDLSASLGYLKTLIVAVPQWIRPYVLSAQIHSRLGQTSEAVNLLTQVLEMNPHHSIAKVELGVLYAQVFRQPEAAENLLLGAVRSSVPLPPQINSRAHLVLAELALQKNERNRALNYAQQAYSLHSANSQAKNLILVLGGAEQLQQTQLRSQQLIYEGDQFMREGDCQAAQAHYQSAFELDPTKSVAAMKAAACMWQMGFSREAIEWLNRAILADPSNVEAYATLADYHSQRYDFVAAARVLSAGQRQAPRAYEILRGYALVELRRGNAQAAVQWGERALQIYPQDVETKVVLAKAHIDLRDFNAAHSKVVQAIEFEPNHRQAQIVYAKALAGLQGSRAGISYLTELVQLYPQISEYGVGLGQILLEEDRYAEASQLFARIHQIDPNSKEILLWWGRALKGERKFNESLDVLLKAAVMDPGDAEALFEVGAMYLQLGRHREAVVQFERVLQINPNYPRAHYFKGRAELLGGNLRRALEQAEAEKRLNPNLADAYLLAAEVQASLKQYSLCAQEYQRAIRLRPQSARIYVRLAQCYRLSGSLDVAISMLRQAANQESGLPEIYREQGEVFLMQGDRVRAIEAFKHYFVLNPNAPDRAQLQRRIEALQGG